MSKMPRGYFYLRHVAGEGRYHPYRQLMGNRRLFLFLKYLKTSLSYFLGAGAVADSAIVCFVKGGNQLRHHKYTASLRASRGCEGSLFVDSSGLSSDEKLLPRFGLGSIVRQFFFLILMLLSGRKRFLSLYFVEFYRAIEKSVEAGFSGVEVFVCYNDQPYDVAAIVCVLNEKGGCKTIVIQHGLILSPAFYFPTIAAEFWAWGDLSGVYYKSRLSSGAMVVSGRYAEDALHKVDAFARLGGGCVNILVATSYFHRDFKELISTCDTNFGAESGDKFRFSYKFHPATKFKWLLRIWMRRNHVDFFEVTENMERLVDDFDVLITHNSTSSVDFLLRGKMCCFMSPRVDGVFPSNAYGIAIRDLRDVLTGSFFEWSDKNMSRVDFLRKALNV